MWYIYTSGIIFAVFFDNLPTDLDEISDTWNFKTDGLAYYYDKDETLLRK